MCDINVSCSVISIKHFCYQVFLQLKNTYLYYICVELELEYKKM